MEEGTADGQRSEACIVPRKFERKEIYCPRTWNECCKSLKTPSLLVKVHEDLTLEDASPWHKFCLQALLICIHTQKQEEEKAADVLKSCSDILHSSMQENFFREILEGLEHVLLSCELFIYIDKGVNEKARLIFSRIKSFNMLSPVCQAAVLAVKAYILLHFGSKAHQEALKCITTAIELDPDELGIRKGAWYCLAGRVHVEMRCNQGFNMMPSPEERRLLERSVQKDPFPIHYVYLADTYRQTARMLLQQSFKNNKDEAEDLGKKARKLYQDAINDENASIKVLCRSGLGLIKLPKQLRNVELARIAFERVLKIDPNNAIALIGLGNLMHWCMNDCKEALKCFEKASSNHPVGKKIIELKSIIDKDYCPLEDCDKYIESEKEMIIGREESILHFHLVKAEYFLIKRNNLMDAVLCWEKAITSSPSAKEIWEYNCLYAKEKGSKLSKMILDEINLALKKVMDKDDVRYFKKILSLSNVSPQGSSNAGKI